MVMTARLFDIKLAYDEWDAIKSRNLLDWWARVAKPERSRRCMARGRIRRKKLARTLLMDILVCNSCEVRWVALRPYRRRLPKSHPQRTFLETGTLIELGCTVRSNVKNE
jgi:hypothetical protein